MVNMENKMAKIDTILNDLGFENVTTTHCFCFIYKKDIIMGKVVANYSIEVYGKNSYLYLTVFGLDYEMKFNTEDLIKENAIIDAMLKILIKAERARTRIYNNFIDELNDLK